MLIEVCVRLAKKSLTLCMFHAKIKSENRQYYEMFISTFPENFLKQHIASFLPEYLGTASLEIFKIVFKHNVFKIISGFIILL